MPFSKGDPLINRTGRPKGTKSKSAEQIRKMLRDFISDNIEQIQSDYEQLPAKDRLFFLDRIIRHVMPAPMNDLERLPDDQLDELIKRIKNGQYEN